MEKQIEGYEDYTVDTNGDVWSYKRNNKRKLKKSNSKGYHVVTLCMDNVRKNFSVHRLVLCAFVPNPDNKPQVNHINEVKTDNMIDNLEWTTSTENINHGTLTARATE